MKLETAKEFHKLLGDKIYEAEQSGCDEVDIVEESFKEMDAAIDSFEQAVNEKT